MIPVKVWRGNESLSTPTGTVTPYPQGTSLICRWSGFDSGSSNSQEAMRRCPSPICRASVTAGCVGAPSWERRCKFTHFSSKSATFSEKTASISAQSYVKKSAPAIARTRLEVFSDKIGNAFDEIGSPAGYLLAFRKSVGVIPKRCLKRSVK